MIRVVLPYHLRNLAGCRDKEVILQVEGGIVTQRKILDALEARFPQLGGTVRDYGTGARRPLVRFFGCGKDLSLDSPDAPVPDTIARGEEPYRIVGSVAGG